MSKSSSLRVQDAIEVMRLVGDVRELRGDPAAQRKTLVHGAVRLFDARHAFSVVFRDLTPEGTCAPESMVAGGESEDALVEFLQWWSDAGGFAIREDPLVDEAGKSQSPEWVQSVGIGLEPERWQGSRVFQDFTGPAGIRDVAVAHFDASPNGDLGEVAIGLSIQRMKDRPSFSARELAKLRLLNHELRRVYQGGLLRWSSLHAETLTQRQRQIGRGMLRGLGAKQIARELDVSVHTVYAYSKMMYRRLGVMDRLELVALLTARPELLAEPVTPERVVASSKLE